MRNEAIAAKGAMYDFAEIDRLLDPLVPYQLYPADTVLFEQGSFAQEAYFINDGLVKLHRVISGGKEFIVDLRFAGWLLGVPSIIVKEPNPVAAITLTKCRLRRLPANTFLDLIKSNSDFAWYIHQVQSREVFNEIARIVQLGCFSAQQRLEQLLWQLISATEPESMYKQVQLQLLLKHWEISQLIAVTPQHLSRVFKDMQKQGMIRQEKGWIIVPDPQRLYHQANS
jgi:CRP-like cAMP-binding protein